MLLQNALSGEGRRVDVRLADGLVAEVAPASALSASPREEVLDLDGYLLLPALAEPHTHLDKALTADRFGREFTELLAAIDAWHGHRETLGIDDIAARARRAALRFVANGATAIRTHADVGQGIELRAVEALVRVREELRPLADVQVVALTYPLTGVAGASNRSLLREALAMGADVAGGAPHVDPDPAGHVEAVLEEAAEAGRPVDLHADENMRPDSVDLLELVARVAQGFPHGATASHCVSLGVQPPEVQAERAAAAAAAGVAVVTCPVANLYLQARDRPAETPRGLTALAALRAAGATLAGGGDNVQDCFIPVGPADPLVTAQYLVVAGQLTPGAALELVGSGARAVMGLPPLALAPGSPADLVAVGASSPREAVAAPTSRRLVFRRGELVCRTDVASTSAADALSPTL
ncbi:MAG TPA: amidohydrolase family protein [Gaiellaceae bacterium]|nr:amidohydrolase family protein [Gaiellaceae bacterium]